MFEVRVELYDGEEIDRFQAFAKELVEIRTARYDREVAQATAGFHLSGPAKEFESSPADIKLGTTAAPIDGAIMYNSSDDATGAADTVDSEPAAEVAAPAPIPEPESVAEATAEEATDALRAFLKGHPLPAAVSILKDFGVARVPELAPEKRAAFIARLQSTGKTQEATK